MIDTAPQVPTSGDLLPRESESLLSRLPGRRGPTHVHAMCHLGPSLAATKPALALSHLCLTRLPVSATPTPFPSPHVPPPPGTRHRSGLHPASDPRPAVLQPRELHRLVLVRLEASPLLTARLRLHDTPLRPSVHSLLPAPTSPPVPIIPLAPTFLAPSFRLAPISSSPPFRPPALEAMFQLSVVASTLAAVAVPGLVLPRVSDHRPSRP